MLHQPHSVLASIIPSITPASSAILPRIAGCLQSEASCRCVTERGTPVELPRSECEAIAERGRSSADTGGEFIFTFR
jgi:hypothetical protein